MKRIDLDAPRFSQADALQLVPGLPIRTLQNWASRRLLDQDIEEVRPGKGAPRLYSGLGIVALSFMRILVGLGIPPRAARALFDELTHAVTALHRAYPAEDDSDGRLHWAVAPEITQRLQSAYISSERDGGYRVRLQHSYFGGVSDPVYIVVELDVLSLAAFNRIYAFLAEKLNAEDSINSH